jgi:hypothetical protein
MVAVQWTLEPHVSPLVGSAAWRLSWLRSESFAGTGAVCLAGAIPKLGGGDGQVELTAIT